MATCISSHRRPVGAGNGRRDRETRRALIAKGEILNTEIASSQERDEADAARGRATSPTGTRPPGQADGVVRWVGSSGDGNVGRWGGKFGVGRTARMARVIPGNGDRSRPFRAGIADPSPAAGATDAVVECDERRGYTRPLPLALSSLRVRANEKSHQNAPQEFGKLGAVWTRWSDSTKPEKYYRDFWITCG